MSTPKYARTCGPAGLVLFLLAITPLSAQNIRERPWFGRPEPTSLLLHSQGFGRPAAPPSAFLAHAPVRPSHWRIGALIGAVGGIVFANVLVNADASPGRRVGLSVVSGAVLAVPGALIGGLFPKRE